jgi:hypothetical protein
MKDIQESLSRAVEMFGQWQVFGAEALLEEAEGLASDSPTKAEVEFALGVLNWCCLGKGESARPHFEAAVALGGPGPFQIGQAPSNACENLMLMARSYDEYERWAAHLERICPGADILRGQAPKVRADRERGAPWVKVLAAFAQQFQSNQRPGEASSTLQTLLLNRKSLRPDRELWQKAALAFAGLRLHLCGKYTRTGADADPGMTPDKATSFLVEAVAFYEDYLKSAPDDQLVREKLEIVRDTLNKLAGAFGPAEPSFVMYRPKQFFDASRTPPQSASAGPAPTPSRSLRRATLAAFLAIAASILIWYLIRGRVGLRPVEEFVLAGLIGSYVAWLSHRLFRSP